jgi:hypothetical protein
VEERIPEPRRNKNASILASLEEYEVDVSRGIEPRSEGKMPAGKGVSHARWEVSRGPQRVRAATGATAGGPQRPQEGHSAASAPAADPNSGSSRRRTCPTHRGRGPCSLAGQAVAPLPPTSNCLTFPSPDLNSGGIRWRCITFVGPEFFRIDIIRPHFLALKTTIPRARK